MIACIAVSKPTEKKILDDKLIVQVRQVHFLLGVEITEIISPEFIFI